MFSSASDLVETVLDLGVVNIVQKPELELSLTLHRLFNSNPGGASGLSVCPLEKPVNLLSRSITAVYSVCWHEVIVVGVILCYWSLALGTRLNSRRSTHSVPRIKSTPCLLSSILHLSERTDGGGAEREHLRSVSGGLHMQLRGRCTPIMIPYGSKASNGTPMAANVPYGGVWLWNVM